ncbi:MAG TPA: hypothetical protein DFS52_20775, partial [Myxococcales bacterium]|nr:hypothetical protein [Myxococcales bacterium]
MRPNRSCSAPIAALLLPLLFACDPKVKVDRAEGIAVFEELASDGTAKLVDTTTLDFGPVLLCARSERKVVLRNDGRGSFRVDAALENDGYDASFRYQFEPMTLEVGDRVELVFFFEPSGAPGDRASKLTLRIFDANIEQLVIDLKGRAVDGGCLVEPQEALDFGHVALGTTFTRQVRITNSSDLPWTAKIAGITSELDPESFLLAGFEPGEITVPEHGEIVVPIEFRPAHLGEHSAFLHLPAPAICEPHILTLSGRGVDSVLECEPKVLATDPNTGAERWVWRLDFGFVNPGSKSVLPVVCTNLGNTDITLTGFELQQPPGKGDPFALETRETSLVAAAGGGTVELPLSFEPRLLGLQLGALHLLTDDAKTPQAKVELVGTGGGPDIEVLPPRLDLGRVAVDTTKAKAITIANVGTDISGTTEDNLRLVERRDGEWVEKHAELITDWPEELSLGEGLIGYLPQGIPAGASVDLKVFFSPTSPGRKSAVLRIYSNDPDEPTVRVEVVASAEVMPPCDYEVVPSQIPFGVVEPGQYSTIPFFVHNKAADPLDECIVATLGFSRGTPAAFSLPEGEITEAVIKGGEVLEVPVRFSPRADGQYTGAVEFYVSSPSAPMGQVALSGTSLKGCLLIAPNELDFGPVEVDCNARERVFTIYNVCPSNITLTSIETQQGLST